MTDTPKLTWCGIEIPECRAGSGAQVKLDAPARAERIWSYRSDWTPEMADSLNDRIHPASGRLLMANEVTVPSQTRWTDPLDYPGGETIEFTGEAPPVLAIPASRGVQVTDADTPEDIARKLEQARDVLYRQ